MYTRKGNLCGKEGIMDRSGYLTVKLSKLFDKNKATLAVAESCTGGLICHQITNISGCSSYFRGGIVAYSDKIKVNVLGVPEEVILRFGAVSGPTVEHMAHQAARLFESQWAVAVSGIAGPTGAIPGKPVGLVWVAVTGPGKTKIFEYRFGGTRKQIKNKATQAALNMLLHEFRHP
jgi:PncC family amidohydrolase